MNISKMLGATMVAGALATAGAAAGISGAAAATSSTTNAASTTPSTDDDDAQSHDTSAFPEIGSAQRGDRETLVPEHGLRVHRKLRQLASSAELGCQLPGGGSRG